ncbi:uncharacterized protein E0L32_009280 [Thyridium curvatum]|uniref:Nicotinamide riboside kinase n=1 Tax=Thyridium curvatum TaxID=1093900 RepID=A0A507AQ52_9PEZI|nr:uncharacterized protein E0L32_009280 [Thyridium curvatum]TPX09537.1 hypothetical protein E0L32_009280 [Thyridium curvatum]
MEQSLQHIRSSGTFPVSPSTRRLCHRSEHGCSVDCLGAKYPPASSSTPLARTEGPALTQASSAQPTLESKEDQNSVGQRPVSDAKIAAAKARVHRWLQPGQPGHDILISNEAPTKICLLDGFLLYSRDLAGVMDLIDIKLFLLVSHAKATQRREARDGYVTLEGFWKDPPGYVDRIVWPNYAKAHAWLFKDGDVEGELDERVLVSKGIKAQMGRGLDIDMETTLDWAVETIILELERRLR